jgi:HD-GYP domain-containing protein (c-di-GMP phosphodiesterase class II)
MSSRDSADVTQASARREFQVLAAKLMAAAQFQQIYPPRHPRVEEGVRDFHVQMSDQLQRRGKIQLALAPGEFLLGAIQIPIDGELLEEFAALLDAAGVQKIEFVEGLREWEMRRFLRLLLTPPEELRDLGGLAEAIPAAGITHVVVSTIRLEAGRIADPESLFRTWEAYSTGLRLVRSVRGRAREEGEVGDVLEVGRFAEHMIELAIGESRPLLVMQNLKAHDEYSFTHSVNVAMLTVSMASCLPFEKDDLHEIGVAAMLHDIGKELIPLEILQKEGKLTEAEWEIVNRHGRDGARMLAAAEGIGDLPPIVAYEHHAHYHPDLRAGEEWAPHLASQMICLADVYDALRSDRPYRDGLPPDIAMETIEKDVGRVFNPDLFEGFSRMLGYYPPGTPVVLEDRTLAIVYAANPSCRRQPHVLVVKTAAGERPDPPQPLNLMHAGPSHQIKAVVEAESLGIDPLDVL